MKKAATYAAVATLSIGSAIGAMAATPAASTDNTNTLHQRIVTMQSRALAQHDTQLAAALARADAALTTHGHTAAKADGNSNSNACPPQSQGGRHGVTDPPCGIPSGALPICPSQAPQPGSTPPCGNGQGQGPGGGSGGSGGGSGGSGGGGGTAACGPADAGGTAPAGPVTNPLYQIGEQISANGGAPLGDAVQSLACAVNGATGL